MNFEKNLSAAKNLIYINIMSKLGNIIIVIS
jgi:hypothetical protein